jgi:hypothetical protein
MSENLSLVFEACDIRVDNGLPDALATQGVLALLCHSEQKIGDFEFSSW